MPYQRVQADAQKRYAFVNTNWDLLRTPKALMPPNTATAQRMLDVAGYDSLIDRQSVEMLRQIDGKDPAPPSNGNIMHVQPKFDAHTSFAQTGSDAGAGDLIDPVVEPDGVIVAHLSGFDIAQASRQGMLRGEWTIRIVGAGRYGQIPQRRVQSEDVFAGRRPPRSGGAKFNSSSFAGLFEVIDLQKTANE